MACIEITNTNGTNTTNGTILDLLKRIDNTGGGSV